MPGQCPHTRSRWLAGGHPSLPAQVQIWSPHIKHGVSWQLPLPEAAAAPSFPQAFPLSANRDPSRAETEGAPQCWAQAEPEGTASRRPQGQRPSAPASCAHAWSFHSPRVGVCNICTPNPAQSPPGRARHSTIFHKTQKIPPTLRQLLPQPNTPRPVHKPRPHRAPQYNSGVPPKSVGSGQAKAASSPAPAPLPAPPAPPPPCQQSFYQVPARGAPGWLPAAAPAAPHPRWLPRGRKVTAGCPLPAPRRGWQLSHRAGAGLGKVQGASRGVTVTPRGSAPASAWDPGRRPRGSVRSAPLAAQGPHPGAPARLLRAARGSLRAWGPRSHL